MLFHHQIYWRSGFVIGLASFSREDNDWVIRKALRYQCFTILEIKGKYPCLCLDGNSSKWHDRFKILIIIDTVSYLNTFWLVFSLCDSLTRLTLHLYIYLPVRIVVRLIISFAPGFDTQTHFFFYLLIQYDIFSHFWINISFKKFLTTHIYDTVLGILYQFS